MDSTKAAYEKGLRHGSMLKLTRNLSIVVALTTSCSMFLIRKLAEAKTQQPPK